MKRNQKIGLYLGVILFLTFAFIIDIDPQNPAVSKTAAVALLMAVWWIFEAVPLATTSLVPLIFFPVLGVLSGSDLAGAYINSVIFLFLGGFMIAIAMETWGLHKRIALKIISIFGSSPNSILYGFMLAAFFLSMWISNTATALMMLPIALAVISKLEEDFSKEKINKFSKGLLLGIAYSCSIGGISTLVGTPPNLAFLRIFKIIFPQAPTVTFGSWMLLALPISFVLLMIMSILISKILFKVDKDVVLKKEYITSELNKLGKITYEQTVILIVFTLTALLWIFRADLDLGFYKIPGWSSIFSVPEYIDDGTVAIIMGFVLFLIPARNKEKTTILSGEVYEKIPWSIILLFGGGFALATAFSSSGLSDFIGSQLKGMVALPVFLLVIIVCFIINFLTELTSNTATTQILLPIIASVSIAVGINPLLLMIAGTLSASMAFMLPVATPPNTIIFASRRLEIIEMAKTGFVLNIISVLLISLLVFYLGDLIFNLHTFPAWAKGN